MRDPAERVRDILESIAANLKEIGYGG